MYVVDAFYGADLLVHFVRKGLRSWAGGRCQGHHYLHIVDGEHIHLIDQAEVPDVYGDLGIEDFFDLISHFFL